MGGNRVPLLIIERALILLSLLFLTFSAWEAVQAPPEAESGSIRLNDHVTPRVILPKVVTGRILSPHASSPQKSSPYAYATLCVGNSAVMGASVLFHSLRKAGSTQGDFVALTYNVSIPTLRFLHQMNVRTYKITPLQVRFHYLSPKRESTSLRDGILWSKLRVWQLEDYDKVVMMDSDMIALQSIDELFRMPEFAGAPTVDAQKEKIQFWKTGEYGLRFGNTVQRSVAEFPRLVTGWSGLNSGITVLVPSNATFGELLNELEIIPNRPCCPSQEFLYHFFESRKRFYRLPQTYNGRLFGDGDSVAHAVTKVFHFVGEKPWKREDGTKLNTLWWKYKREVDALTD
ncbi:nucleotide-diphospho-sugar transferase [Cladochytrium replicatum]|nr:nucleotide-diphospho-sugar transferase [Cladochytrium replicatum]